MIAETVLLRGVPLRLHPPGEGVSDGIRRSGDFYEAEMLDYIRDHYPEQRTIVDAGANIGNHAVYFASFLAHERIDAFEPVPENLALLEANTADLVTVKAWPNALSDVLGMLQMAANPGNMGACLVAPDGEIEVAAVTLDSLNLPRVSLLKVDVENHEAEVLAGARQTIARDHPLVLIEDWTFGGAGALLPGYVLERGWDAAFTYLYRWPS